VQKGSFIQAHGSSTPKNCVSEADIFDRVAQAFSIRDWPVTAVKSYLGHSWARQRRPADQLPRRLPLWYFAGN
jgi:hypothetical protein